MDLPPLSSLVGVRRQSRFLVLLYIPKISPVSGDKSAGCTTGKREERAKREMDAGIMGFRCPVVRVRRMASVLAIQREDKGLAYRSSLREVGRWSYV